MKELSKAYSPGENETTIYEKWEKSGYFNPNNLSLPEDAPTYTIVLPPPNITDKLHLGHSSMLAIEDLLIRYHRMNGYKALWIPGTDHAAIATQNVVEKKLKAEENKTRHDLGREKFLGKVWDFLEETQATILKQTRKMGASLDWSREAFTLDEPRQKAVTQMFVDMYNAGVIYQGERIVNWCPRCHSTLADDEVEYKEQTTKLYWIKYGPFVLATTRPETKLGDTAVAVNPKDERYQEMIDKEYSIKGVLGDFKITVIADRNVDMDFGSGAVKVTPAHSFIDNEMARKNNIPMKQIIDEDGKMMDNCGKYSGMPVEKAREEIVKDMKKMGLIDHIDEDYKNKLSVCYRCDTAIEPLPSKQWFVSVDKKLDRLGGKSLKEKAIEVAKEKQISFIPNRFEKRYIDWMENLHDWCISRQIWFGHRIPVWYKNDEIYIGIKPPKDVENWKQDPDVLDTWFSSGMWTFSTLGWPDNFEDGKKSGDLKNFHPTQVLETGYEILTLWVSRMIMMSLFAVGEIPFEDVYLHGMVLDEHGKKMSKSKGNGIDPIDVIDKFGTDAVRLSLLIGNTPGNNLRIGEEKIAGMRNLINKLWNISRYIEATYQISEMSADNLKNFSDSGNLTLADQWILTKFSELTLKVTQDIQDYRFSEAGEKLKEFTWNDLADWYLEISKTENNSEEKTAILKFVLGNLLKLWHPFIPFVTEKLWQELFTSDFLMISPWPKIDSNKQTEETLKNFSLLQNVITAIRNIRTQYKIVPKQKIEVVIYAHDKLSFLEKQTELISNLKTGIDKIIMKESGDKISRAHYEIIDEVEIYVPLQDIIDIPTELKRLEEEIKSTENFIAGISKKLDNKSFVENAPEMVVNKEREKLATQENKLKNLKKYFENIS